MCTAFLVRAKPTFANEFKNYFLMPCMIIVCLILFYRHVQTSLFIKEATIHMIQDYKTQGKVVLVDGIYAFQCPNDYSIRLSDGLFLHLIERVANALSKPGQNKQDLVQHISQTIYPSYKVRQNCCLSHHIIMLVTC